jgi:hypothetical protein
MDDKLEGEAMKRLMSPPIARGGGRVALVVLAALFLVTGGDPRPRAQAALDICGCASVPDALDFDTHDPADLVAVGATPNVFRNIVIPVPESGVLVFKNVRIRARTGGATGVNDSSQLFVTFARNAANSPVTILVQENFVIEGTAFGTFLSVDGSRGGNGSSGGAGQGGNGGPGGFRGGDGAYPLVNFSRDGGAGLGPRGGAPGLVANFNINNNLLGAGGDGQFLGVRELIPLVGGSGGGGGASTASLTPSNPGDGAGCSGGGGGGGGGAILIAANGTITVGSSSSITAIGGDRGDPANNSCARFAGGGSGGAIRLVANRITGSGQLSAVSGTNVNGSRLSPGSIRMEAIVNEFSADNTSPVASRSPAPGPLTNPLTPTVRITSIGGSPPPLNPQGAIGQVDVILPAPATTAIDLATSGVPSGTIVDVTVKPRVGANALTGSVPLSNCDANGNCSVSVAFNLGSGAFTIEARATFQTP